MGWGGVGKMDQTLRCLNSAPAAKGVWLITPVKPVYLPVASQRISLVVKLITFHQLKWILTQRPSGFPPEMNSEHLVMSEEDGL